jgi:hypothetical protein
MAKTIPYIIKTSPIIQQLEKNQELSEGLFVRKLFIVFEPKYI